MVNSLEAMVAGKLKKIDAQNLRRGLKPTERFDHAVVCRGGKKAISFCCNDYLNLSTHPAVKEASKVVLENFGLGSGASRLVTGNTPFNGRVEQRLARLKGSESALVFGSGYLANMGVIPALIGPNDLIVMDELSHACMYGGAQLSGAKIVLFKHNDPSDCQSRLAEHRKNYERCLMLTEGVFSMDGDLAPLADLSDLAKEFDAWLMTDDAHGLGVLGDGRGTVAHWNGKGCNVDVPLQMGTLSKAVGAYGGYICASQKVIDFLVNRARTVIFTTGLPPAVLAGVDKALEIIETDKKLANQPVEKAKLFTSLLGLPDAQSSIVPVVLGDEERALKASAQLEKEGFLITAIRPPTVPAGTARLRLTFCAEHKEEDIHRLASLFKTMELVA
ncbi:MAG: 8-amino-7-oxononanoate synthase [Rhodospirillales bacterium]|nr:8-amino-7-oxononanoate synthase [Rhodospirillales bacterium]